MSMIDQVDDRLEKTAMSAGVDYQYNLTKMVVSCLVVRAMA
jgi:hypothetical protein